jgi:hypothetical protein
MERSTKELLEKQLEIKEALKLHKLQKQALIGKEIELIEKEIEIIKSQIKGKSPLEEIKIAEPRKWHVVFNGPFPGIYDDWFKAAPHCQKISGVTHKAYATKEEAEKALKEHNDLERSRKEIYLGPRTFSETARSTQEEKNSTMKILGRIPSSLDNFPIISRREHEAQIQFSQEKFKEYFTRLANWNERERINCFYLVDRKLYGIKAIITQGASPLLVFNMFQFGLIECIYLSKNLEEINMFPSGIKSAVQAYKENIAGERTIYLKFYSAYPDFSTNQSAKHFIYTGISNNNYPLMDEPTRREYNEEEYDRILVNQLISIYTQCLAIGKDSCIKVLHRHINSLLLSKTGGKPLKEKDFQSLTNFEIPFYSLDKNVMNYKEWVLSELCKNLQESKNHLCERCVPTKAEAMDKCKEEEDKSFEEKEGVAK